MEKNLLSMIHSPEDIKSFSAEETKALCQEIREFLVENVSRGGGHLSPNLGVVELTCAICQSFDLKKDKIVWDVGHQAYVYKILTGRADRFDTLRQKNGLSGFPKMAESEYDVYDAGHASTSISVAYGLVKARDLKKEDHHVVCVIGDGSMTGGLAYEAMNNAGHDKTGMIVILNDNKMSINKSVGSLANHLGTLRTRSSYLKGKSQVKQAVKEHPALQPVYNASHYLKDRIKYMVTDGVLFEEMGFTYLGPVDGHDVQAVRKALDRAKLLKEPVLVHVITKKGKGYQPAEEDPERFHGVGPFDPVSGKSLSSSPCETYAEVFGKTVSNIGKEDERVALVTAAMTDGTGLTDCEKTMKGRVFDVGIAEEHAVTFAGGLAKGGMRPFVAIYSTFLQRAYDEILEDVCLQDVPVVLALDHAGIVGEDGETHQGIYDIAFLSHMPNMAVMAPSGKTELIRMLEFANQYDHPIAIRYPKGPALETWVRSNEAVEFGKSVILRDYDADSDLKKVTVLAVGAMVQPALEAAEKLGCVNVRIVDVRFVMPLNTDFLKEIFETSDLVVTVEDGVKLGGYGSNVQALSVEMNWKTPCKVVALPNAFLPQDNRNHALKAYGLSADNLCELIQNHSFLS